MAVWSRQYCCCAVPLYNAGIYAIMLQFVVVSFTAAGLAFAAPKITAVAIPSFGPWLFGILCCVVGALQLLGIIAVKKDKQILFRNYYRLNLLFTLLALAAALVFIILSAVRHSTAVQNCTALFTSNSNEQVNDTTATTICNYWSWAQLGIMGLLFLIVALAESYFLVYESIYASEQRLDHAKYESVLSMEKARNSQIWDAGRTSTDNDRLLSNHERTFSTTSSGYNRPEKDSYEYGAGPPGAYAYEHPETSRYTEHPLEGNGAAGRKQSRRH